MRSAPCWRNSDHEILRELRQGPRISARGRTGRARLRARDRRDGRRERRRHARRCATRGAVVASREPRVVADRGIRLPGRARPVRGRGRRRLGSTPRAGQHARRRCACLRRRDHARALRGAAGEGRGGRHPAAAHRRAAGRRRRSAGPAPQPRRAQGQGGVVDRSRRRSAASPRVATRAGRSAAQGKPRGRGVDARGVGGVVSRRRCVAGSDVRQRHAVDRRRVDGGRCRARPAAPRRSPAVAMERLRCGRLACRGRRGGGATHAGHRRAASRVLRQRRRREHPARRARQRRSGGRGRGDRPAPGRDRDADACRRRHAARARRVQSAVRRTPRRRSRTVPEWRASLLCGDDELARATGLRAQKRYQLFNGAIECSLIVCDPVAQPQRAADAPPPVLSDGAQMVANRLRKNLKKLKAWRERDSVDCWRAYDADLPEYAAAIDVYTTADSRETWLHVQEYAAPAEIPEATTRRRLNELLAAARDVFGLPKERIALKTRSIGKGGSKYGRFDRRGETLVVREGDARLRVNLFDYLDTGVFLDHRPLRLQFAREAQGKRFLNLFCYTGAATVQAARGGAASTTSVDLSGTYLQWLSENLRENGIGGGRHRLVQADAMEWLLADRGDYDLVFCDPPTFSNSARAADFDVQREHVSLLRAALARLGPGGALYFSNNYRRFRLDAG